MKGFNSDFLKDIFSEIKKDPLALYKAFVTISTP
jgi:hypothetical protein